MSGDVGLSQATQPLGLNSHNDARAIIRLVQCAQCSYPCREPMTLPCGNTLCRPCLPPLFKRENITYPMDPGRSEGFVCPFKTCGLQHTLSDCSLDITLNKIVEMFKSYISTYRKETSDTPIQLDEQLHWPNVVDSSMDVMPRSRVLHGGRLVATYVLADMGELNYFSDVTYTPSNPDTSENIEALDVAVGNNLKEVLRGELECQVCYGLMLDPLTTSCGHTFCRKCVARVLDHSNLCPICRRRLHIPPGVQSEPTNKGLSNIISGLYADLLAARIESTAEEDAVDEESNMPLFPCTLAYPLMPTFLHIFEPRYRLMVRRVMENGTQKFGILAYNSARRPQPGLGHVPFLEYGTVLHVQRIEMFPDGRSLVETRGLYRFRVRNATLRDGYYVAHIQRVDDIPIAEEESLEVHETSQPEPDAEDSEGILTHMSTQGLLQYCLNFIEQARARSAPWLHERVLAAYGQPSTDPATFPYWFASILPISEDEKYLLLPTASVRERLKITARWIQRLEAARCNHEATLGGRTVLDSSSDEEEEEEDDDDDEDDEGGEEVVRADQTEGNDVARTDTVQQQQEMNDREGRLQTTTNPERDDDHEAPPNTNTAHPLS